MIKIAKSLSRLEDLFLKKSSSSTLQIDSLDGLRGIAIGLVLLSHLSLFGFNWPPILDFSGSGRYGVYLFFSLSAFLLTLPIAARNRKEILEFGLWKKYFIRRFLRILPLYSVVLFVSHIYSTYIGKGYFIQISRSDLLRHLTMLEGKDLLWAIPVEFRYYLILPFVCFLFIVILKKNIPLAILIFTSVICVTDRLIWPTLRLSYHPLSLLPHFPIFLTGSLAALVHCRIAEIGGIRTKSLRHFLDLAAVIVFACIFLLVPRFWTLATGENVSILHFHEKFILFSVLWPLLLLAYLNGSGTVDRILKTRPLRFLGIISFSLYLWHLPILRFINLRVNASPPMKGLLGMTIILIVSAISYLAIERPFMKMGVGRLHGRTKSAAEARSLVEIVSKKNCL